MSNESAKSSSPNTIQAIRDVLFFIGLYLLFSGWTYIHSYLNYFGIPIEDASVDYTQIVIFSFAVFGYYLMYYPILFVALNSLLVFCLYKFSKHYDGFEKRLKFFLIIVLLTIFFPIVFTLSKCAGKGTAQRQSNQSTTTLKKVQFIFKDNYLKKDSINFETQYGKFQNDNFLQKRGLISINNTNSGNFRLVLSNKDKYFIVYMPGDHCVPIVYSIIKDDVHNIKIAL